ncbi:MAG: hypothetical protein RMX97_32700 [Nostoc sp. DedQUE11]|nr:hypothetical protein [Nostoc sp. DedQUE11]
MLTNTLPRKEVALSRLSTVDITRNGSNVECPLGAKNESRRQRTRQDIKPIRTKAIIHGRIPPAIASYGVHTSV